MVGHCFGSSSARTEDVTGPPDTGIHEVGNCSGPLENRSMRRWNTYP